MTTATKFPLVTVLLPTFNRQTLLEGCLESLLAQTYPHFRVEVLDNGSTPRVELPPNVAADKRFKLVRIEDNSFRVPFMLEHTRKVSTPYTAYIFDDDRWEMSKLEEQIELLESRPDVSACFTHVTIIDDHGSVNPAPPAPYPQIFQVMNRSRAEWVRHFFNYGNCLCAPSAVMRTSAMSKLMHRLPLKQLWDFSNWINLLGAGNLYVIEKPLTRFRVFLSGENESAINTESLSRLNYETSRILHQFRKLPPDLLREAYLSTADAGERLDDDINRVLYEEAVQVGSASHLRFAAEVAEESFTQCYDAGAFDLAAAWSNRFVAAASRSQAALKFAAPKCQVPRLVDDCISFIICSIDDAKYAHISARLDSICTTPHEIIRIADAKSLSEGYSRGISKARFNTVVLCHDDIDLLCESALADILHCALHEFDLVGVAGPRVLKSAFWLNGGPSNTVGCVIHGPVGKSDAQFAINYYDCLDANRIAVQALDGVFIAAKKSVFDHVQFDADLFDGFHLYDIDFTYRCHLAGLRVGVAKDLFLVHASSGNFGDDWLRYEARFRQKFPALAPARLRPRQAPATIYASSLAEAAWICRNSGQLPDEDAALPPLLSSFDRVYSSWLNRTSMKEMDAQLLAERMMLKWTKRPGIHLLMALRGGEEHLLADTLDSLAAQLYPDWLLTVVTDLPQPAGMDEAPSVQWLSLQDSVHIDYVIEEVAAASHGTWLARIDPGLTFEPHALQIIADYINIRPMWHLIYCDEDTREADGRFTQPLFKPDLNLDLLRAQNYFGAFVLVEKEAFNVVGRYGAHRGAETYDLSLRILDQVGPQSIGHIDQMLVHLPRKSARAMEPEAERRAVVDHLQRCGLDAEVREGLVPGTRHVQYRWSTAPLVSIVIQTRDREEYLRPMLDSLDELTAYSNYELIIVDNDTQDPDAVDWLKTLPDDPRWRGRAKVLHASGPFNWAAGANYGAGAARGDYLLFLDNDMHIVQPEWLSRLMSIAQRPEVGIVGPRLAFAETARVQETGWVLGLYGLASSPWKKDMELTEPGYMGRAVCDQEVGAVSGSALLVRSSVLSDVGGFDATCFPVFDAALDLCLRVREQGKSVVCTPYSMLVHYGGVSMNERQKEPGCALEDLLARKAEREAMLSRWLHRLANDPTYNKNLSLIEPFEPEHIAPLTWDTNFRERTRILGIPLSGGAGEYRLRAPLKAISRAGLAQTMICEPPAPKTVRILTPVEFARIDPDVIIFHQPVDDLQTESLRNLAKYLPDVRRIITIDDLITAVPKKNSFHKFGFKDAKPRLRKTLSLAERVVVSTEPLADFCRGMIDDIRIMPNCLEQAIWNGAAPPRSPRCKPRVGWAGAQQHLGDLELIYPVVEALANEVDWIFMGMCPDPLRPFVREFHDFVRDFEAYPSKLAQLDLDLAIAPLEINAFNEAKSNLRLLEYGFMGWPVICTDIFPYQSAPVTRLPNDPERWISTIREQLADPAALERSGHALQEWVLANFILEDHATEWAAAYGR